MIGSRTTGVVLVGAALALAAGGCGSPGGSGDSGSDTTEQATKKPDIAKKGKVTLTVWDQEVRGGAAKQIKALNKEFMAKYPNVTIKRKAKSFEDLNNTLKLAVSGPKPPDVVQANQGLGTMGVLVKGKLIRPVDDYAKIYGWADRYPETLLNLNKFEQGGNKFGSGELYGLSQQGEIVGLYYNKKKVKSPPKTFAEFQQQLEQAKKAGDTPIAFGNLDKWPGIHEYETVLAQTAEKQAVRDFVFQSGDAKFDAPEFTEAAKTLQDWAKKDYFTKGFNGVGYDPAWQRFAKGDGWFLIAGTWLTADLQDKMGEDVGFMLMPGQEEGADPVSLGGESLPFTITAKSKNPDVAAAYVDFLTTEEAGKTLAKYNNLPAMKGEFPQQGLAGEVSDAWKQLSDADGFVPYLDYTTETFYDDLSGALQKLLAEKSSPEEFTKGVQAKVGGS